MESALDIYVIIRVEAISAVSRAGPVCDTSGVYVFLDDSRYAFSSTCYPGARPVDVTDLDGIGGASGGDPYDPSGVLTTLQQPGGAAPQQPVNQTLQQPPGRRLAQWTSNSSLVPPQPEHVALRTAISNLDAFYAENIMQGFIPNLFNASHSRGYFEVYWHNYYAACSPVYCDQTVPGQQVSAFGTAVQVLAMVGGVWALPRLVFVDVLCPLGCLLARAFAAPRGGPHAGK